MELYETTSYKLAKELTERYSTSFSVSITLFPKPMRRHIYAVYGMVRIADEIVDTYRGSDAAEQLEAYYSEVIRACAMKHPYSANPIVHAFALTAQHYDIGADLIDPFFDSMRMDLEDIEYDEQSFKTYIYGSAAVVGLMCLKVFVDGDNTRYNKLAPGAERLGNAYQKVNFLRDIAADMNQLKRSYFPGVKEITETDKQRVIADIQADFDAAKSYIEKLPDSARSAVTLSYRYYQALLDKLENTPAETLRRTRVRVPDIHKLALYVKARVGR